MFANVTTMNGVKCYVMLKTTALLVCISVNNSSNPTNVIVCFAVAPYTLTYFAVKG